MSEPSSPATRLVLIGMMGAGKTTTGEALSARLGWPLRDCDLDLEARTGSTGAELAAAHGVEHLHRLEAEVLIDALDGDGPRVVTAAGSIVSSDLARDVLAARATVVWLDAPVAELMVRMQTETHRRPLDAVAAEALHSGRRDDLASLADMRLDARAPTADLVDEIVRFLGR